MKTISARQFRLTFQELTEPVSVTRRTDEGYVTVGTWSPTLVLDPAIRDGRLLEVSVVPTFRPVPKPRKRA